MWNGLAIWIAVAQAQPPASLRTELIKIAATALLGAITGAIAAYITAKFKEKELNQTFQQRLLELNQTFQNKQFELNQTLQNKLVELDARFCPESEGTEGTA